MTLDSVLLLPVDAAEIGKKQLSLVGDILVIYRVLYMLGGFVGISEASTV